MIIPRRLNGKPMPFSTLTLEQRNRRMLGGPVVTNVYNPTAADLARIRSRGVVEPVEKIVELTDANGTVKVAVDENGQTLDKEKKGLTPLQMGMLAVGAFLLFGG